MSDYARANSGGSTHFGDKDALTTGDANKVIVGAQFDSEFNAILTAVNSKYDSDDLASQAQAEGETLNTVLITPLRLANWADANGGMVGDIQALSDPGADTVLVWDDSDGAVEAFTLGTGLTSTTSAIELDHLGFEDLSDPGADRLIYWDDSATALNWLTIDNGITVDADDTMGLTDVSASTSLPIAISSGTFSWDSSSITEITATGITQSADGVFINDAGVLKVMPWDQMGLPVVNSDAAQTFAITDAWTIQVNTTTARTWTIPTNASVAFEVGSAILLVNSTASSDLTITASSGVTIESVFHANGVDAASDVVRPGGTAVLLKIGTDAWALTGDIVDS